MASSISSHVQEAFWGMRRSCVASLHLRRSPDTSGCHHGPPQIWGIWYLWVVQEWILPTNTEGPLLKKCLNNCVKGLLVAYGFPGTYTSYTAGISLKREKGQSGFKKRGLDPVVDLADSLLCSQILRLLPLALFPCSLHSPYHAPASHFGAIWMQGSVGWTCSHCWPMKEAICLCAILPLLHNKGRTATD